MSLHISATRSKRADSTKLIGLATSTGLRQRGREKYSFRWLLLFIFVAGYFATLYRFEAFIVEYTVLTGFSILACCLLLTVMNKTLQVTLPFWVILAVFISGYYIKFYWIAVFPETEFLGYILNVDFSSITALRSSFATTTYSFGAFCFVSWLLLLMSRDSKMKAVFSTVSSEQMLSVSKGRAVSSISMWIVLILIPITTFIMFATGIAVMGVEGVSLPFRFAGIVFFTRSVFIPTMLLLLIWSSHLAGLHRRKIVGVVILIVFGLSDMLLRSSRGALVILLLSMVFLFLISQGRVRIRYVLPFAVGLLSVSLLHPIISEYRNLRIGSGSFDVLELLVNAQRNVIGGELSAIWDTLKMGVGAILFRLTGIDLLIVFNDLGAQPLTGNAWSVLTSPRGLAGYVTEDIFGIPPHHINAVAAGFIGWFYLIGGNPFVVAGIAGFTSLVYILWGWLKRLRLKCLPVAQVMFLTLLLTITVEGTLDNFVAWPILVWPASIVVCEWLIRSRV